LTTSVHPNWVKTPLIGSWESTLRETGAKLLEPRDVADAIVAQILSCKSGQIILPQTANAAGLLKGFPNWVQEKLRDGLGRAVLAQVKN